MFDDSSYIIYVNGKYRGNDEIGKLMHDFSCTNPDDMNYEALAKKARYYKRDEKGVATMCLEIQMFGFLGTYKLLPYPNFFKETALFKCSA